MKFIRSRTLRFLDEFWSYCKLRTYNYSSSSKKLFYSVNFLTRLSSYVRLASELVFFYISHCSVCIFSCSIPWKSFSWMQEKLLYFFLLLNKLIKFLGFVRVIWHFNLWSLHFFVLWVFEQQRPHNKFWIALSSLQSIFQSVFRHAYIRSIMTNRKSEFIWLNNFDWDLVADLIGTPDS